jgi:predicted DNA-binding transcriptional regulator AlpA
VLASELVDDDGLLDTLADRLADRLAARLSAVEPPQALLDAREVARRTGKTRRWVYEHARELGAVPLGTGPRPRLGFSPDAIAQLKAAPRPSASAPSLPLRVKPRRRGSSSGVSRTVAELLDGPRPVIGARARAGGQS